MTVLTGCQDEPKPIVIKPKHAAIAAKIVPPFMKGTIWEKVDVGNIEPFQVSGYGLVVNLDNSGDTTAPVAVKEYIIKQMYAHGYGSKLMPGFENLSPERVLADKRVAIVQVVGMLPPGIRRGQSFDAVVQALPNNQTTSLAGGQLYLTDLKINGADPGDPFGKINDYAQSKGFLFVNPAYALNKDPHASAGVRKSLRNAVIMDGVVAKYDRPLFLQLRQPESRISRFIEQRVIARFQDVHDVTVAKAEDEGVVEIYVPGGFRGDWAHFSRLVTHLYLDSSPEVAAHKAKMLVDEAQKPDALLEDISYCWEGIGAPAMPFISPLLMDRRPEVAFAAARAAAFIGDSTGAADAALLEMARNSSNPFQLNAIEALGGLTPSASVNQMLHELLDSDKNLVRIEAYKVLVRNRDAGINTRVVTEEPTNQKFVLDIVPSSGPPIIYASRIGMPRIAIIGTMPQLLTPIMFRAMSDRLTISSRQQGDDVSIFFRSPAASDGSGTPEDGRVPDPVKMVSNPDVAELVARLGGICAQGEQPLNFTYSEIVAILQRLHEEQKLVSASNGQFIQAAFVLQDPPILQNMIYNAPSVDIGRPQGEEHPKVSSITEDPAADAALAGRK
jgi:flagellar basal body P-ring protein FlgI